MIGASLVARRAAGQVVVVLVLVGSLSVVVGSLEGLDAGVGVALWVGLLRAPTLLVSLLPVLVAVGVGLAAARAGEHGEREALEAAGVSPARSGLGALAVGLAAGVLGFGAHALGVPAFEAWADAAAPTLGLGWVWVEGGAVSLADDLLVPVADGALGTPRAAGLSPETLARARAQLSPWRASLAQLQDGGPRAAAEVVARVSRVVAAAALAWLAWQPWSTRDGRHAAIAGALGLGWLVVETAARRWALEVGAPVPVGALATLAVCVAASWRAYRTFSQKPV